tara:strand:- start:171 stop:533 length:363 start_codon:yes stop_codon:yes gene_type:complete
VRVKISYGVDIEEVPDEIEELFDFVYRRKLNIDKQLDLVERLIEERDLEAAVATMDKLRLTLAKMDNRISDISSIAQGYIAYKEQEGVQDVSEGRPSVDTVEHGVVSSAPEQPGSDSNNE